MEPHALVLGLAIPAATAGLLTLAAQASGVRRLLGPANRRTLAICGAFAAGHIFVVGWPALPPASSTGWILWLAGLSAAAACAFAAPACPAAWRWMLACAMAGAVPWLLLRPLLAGTWAGWQGASIATLHSLLLLAAWAMGIRLERDTAPRTVLSHLTLCAGGAAAVILLSGSITLARLAGVLAAGAGTVALLASRRGRNDIGSGSAVLVRGVLATVLIAAAAYAELPWWSAGCLWLATLAGWVPLLPAFRTLHGTRRAAVVWSVTFALIAVPFATALARSIAMESE